MDASDRGSEPAVFSREAGGGELAMSMMLDMNVKTKLLGSTYTVSQSARRCHFDVWRYRVEIKILVGITFLRKIQITFFIAPMSWKWSIVG